MTNDLIKYEDYLKFTMGIKDNSINEFFTKLTVALNKQLKSNDYYEFKLVKDETHDPDDIIDKFFVRINTDSKTAKKYFKESGPYVLYIRKP